MNSLGRTWKGVFYNLDRKKKTSIFLNSNQNVIFLPISRN